MKHTFDTEDLFLRVGSFWQNHMVRSEQLRVQKLISLPLTQKLFSVLDNSVKALSNQVSQIEELISISWRDVEAFKTYTPLNNTPEPITASLPSGSTELFYVIPFDQAGITPLTIQSKQGVLSLNVDFFYKFDYIWFVEPLQNLFSNNECLILKAKNTINSYFSYTAQTETVYDNIDVVIDFEKNRLELQGLVHASNVVAKLPFVRKGGTLIDKKEYLDGFIYRFNSGELIKIPFVHKPLELNKFYPKNFVLDTNVLKFYFPKRDNPYWYQAIDWTYGLSLQQISTFHGLILPNNDMFAYTYGQDYGSIDGSKVHTRILLVGDYNTQVDYWNEVALKETATGRYLNEFIGLTNETMPNLSSIESVTPDGAMFDFASLPNTKLVNPIDIYFQAILKDTIFVVEIDERYITNKAELITFIKRNTPPNISPIIRIRKTDTEVIDYVLEDQFNTLNLLVDSNNNPIIINGEFLQRNA